MSVLLRTATLDDLGGIMAIETSTFANDAWSRASMTHELTAPGGRYLVATAPGDDTTVVGYAGMLALKGAREADIQTIAVLAEHQGHGLGRAMLTQLLTEARQGGVREVFLEVRADNPGARHLYETLGFEPIAVRARYYMPDGVDAVVMRLSVPPAVTETAPGRVEPFDDAPRDEQDVRP
ncbi:ribosomal protein S18-alanine N-acetyltransferase [Frigoribacterium sp. PhB24]|uniref:ribosomal protein S18-alanine N-acetyltransferase n=1 Tax=Frigoribacterium sp. PhB24 TaxID=2485204 RepID=UPI000F460E15|nr:ribosomal protein S18-alanine N-acetyltransferase [Frigoribacterium sp. PhB24]